MNPVPKPARGSRAKELIQRKATVRREISYLRILLGKEKGPTATRRATKARAIVDAEMIIKNEVKKLDGYRCRWPGCLIDGSDGRDQHLLEAAHWKAEGSGGDSTLQRCTVENLITLCHFHHRGPRGLHDRGLATMRPLDPVLGMRGEVEFSAAVPGEAGKFYVVGVTEPPKGEQAVRL